jgi:hypothetical protein
VCPASVEKEQSGPALMPNGSFTRQVVLRAIARSVSRLRGGQPGLLPSGTPTVAGWSLPAASVAQPPPLETARSALTQAQFFKSCKLSAQELVKNLRNTQPTGCGKHEPRSLDALR